MFNLLKKLKLIKYCVSAGFLIVNSSNNFKIEIECLT